MSIGTQHIRIRVCAIIFMLFGSLYISRAEIINCKKMRLTWTKDVAVNLFYFQFAYDLTVRAAISINF